MIAANYCKKSAANRHISSIKKHYFLNQKSELEIKVKERTSEVLQQKEVIEIKNNKGLKK